MTAVVNVNEVLDGHIALDLDCLDRIYLNAYVPNLQVGGQVVTFLTQHLATRCRPRPCSNASATASARQSRPSLRQTTFPAAPQAARPHPWDDRKLDHVRPHLEQAEREGRHGW